MEQIQYNNFACDANVEVVRDENSNNIIGYKLNVSIKCEDNNTEFEFDGPLSISENKLVASLPIKPHHQLDVKLITQ